MDTKDLEPMEPSQETAQPEQAGPPEPSAPTMTQRRRAWKKRARKVVRGHYLLLVLLCAISVFYGAEFGFVQSNAESLYDVLTGQEVTLGGDALKLDTEKTRHKVISDLIADNEAAGREAAAEQLSQYENGEVTTSILGRQNGVLAGVANAFSSGSFYLDLFHGAHSIIHSTQGAAALLVFLGLLLSALVWIFLKDLYRAILRRAFLEARTYETVPVGHLLHFRMVRRWIRASLTLLLETVLYTLWCFTIVGAFIKRYSYYLVPYIVAENPDLKPREVITLSRRMMNGYKWECFVAELSLLGWTILGSLTFGFTEVLWSLPYRVAIFSEFYAQRRAEYKEAGLEGADGLNDTYLFEHAEEAFLRQTYADIEEHKRFIDANRVTLPPVRAFFAKNFGLWVGTLAEKKDYEAVDNVRQQIVEDRAVIKGKIYPQRLNQRWNSKKNPILRNLMFLRTYTIWSIILVFFVFSFGGWVWEVSIHLVNDGVFVNRGTMHGPWLPIYGGGVAMIVILLARWRSKPQVEVVLIILLCGVVEYSTSLILEITSGGMRWWDYTGYFLNLNGRICAEGLLVFAIGGMVAVYLLVPLLDIVFSKLNGKILITLCLALVACFVGDLIYSHFVPNVGEGITDYTAFEEATGDKAPAALPKGGRLRA